MALLVDTYGVTGNNKVSSTSVDSAGMNFPPIEGQVILAIVAFDNLSGTTPTVTFSSVTGDVWETVVQKVQNATAAAGVGVAMGLCRCGPNWTTSTVVTATFSGAVTAKAIMTAKLNYYNGHSNYQIIETATNGGASATASVVESGTDRAVDDLILVGVGVESATVPSGADSDTTDGSWGQTSTGAATSGSGSASNVAVYSNKKSVTGTTAAQNWSLTVTNTDWAAVLARVRGIFQDIIQDAFRFMVPSWESSPSYLANQDVSLTGFDITTERKFGLRFRLETTSYGWKAGDTITIQYRVNGGAWANVPSYTDTTAPIRMNGEAGTYLNEGQPSSVLMTGATGTAGYGLCNTNHAALSGMELKKDKYVECRWDMRIPASSSLVDGDVVEFRLVKNTYSGGFVYNVTPSITVSKPTGTPQSDSDSGTATDTGTLTEVQASGTDSGAATDTGSVVVDQSATDSGTATDDGFVQVPQTDSDSGTATDDATLVVQASDSDSGTATDNGSVVADQSATDSGTATDDGSVVVQVVDSDSGTATENGLVEVGQVDSDSGTATDNATLTVEASASDSGTATDDGSVVADQSATDSGTATDNATLTVEATASDTGAATDNATLSAEASDTDSGTATDDATLVVQVSDSDSGTATDSGVLTEVQVTDSDSGVGTDDASLDGGPVPQSGSDSGTATDTGTLTQVQASAFDSAAGVDDGSVVVNLSDSDSATATDNATFTVEATASDTGAASDDATLTVYVTDSDSGTATDSGSNEIYEQKSDSDSGVATDNGAIEIVTGGTVLNDAVAVYYGAIPVIKIYAGAVQVWP